MTNSVAAKVFAGLFLLVCAGSSARAQFSPDSPVGLGAGLAKLFGSTSGFIAKADVQVLDTNRQETLRTPMGFAFLDSKMRLEIDMTQMKGRTISPAFVAGFKQAGLERVVSIFRLDKKMVYMVFSGARSYVTMKLSQADTEAAGKNLQVRKTILGNETVDGHPCVRNRVVVKSSKGATLLEATTWNATDLKDFPLQIAVQAKEGTTVMRFTRVQLARPEAAQFEPPAGFTKFPSADALLLAAAQKPGPAPKTNASRQPKSIESKSAVKK